MTDILDSLRAYGSYAHSAIGLQDLCNTAAGEIEGLRELVAELFGVIAITGTDGVPLDPDPANTLTAYCVPGTAAYRAATQLDQLWAAQGVGA